MTTLEEQISLSSGIEIVKRKMVKLLKGQFLKCFLAYNIDSDYIHKHVLAVRWIVVESGDVSLS